MRLHGVIPILATTFHADGSLDLESQEKLVDHLLRSGAHGLGLFGNASEGYALTPAERVAILKLVRRRARVPLVVSSGHSGTDAAVDLSREAEDGGADALMVLPPFYMRTDGEGIFHYFEKIGKAVGIPIMLQDAPLLTQVALPAALLNRLGREIERVEYAKVEAPPTAPKITAVVEGGSVTALGGLNGNFFIEEHERGARGVMPGSDMTATYRAIWDALEAGDRDSAWQFFTQALPLIRYELQPGLGVSAMKHNLVADGVIACAAVRHPTGAIDSRAHSELALLRRRARA